MNRPIRRVAVTVGVLFLALLVNLNYVQVAKSSSYRNNPHNGRVLIDEYTRQRGSITTADGVTIAESVPKPNDRLKYLRVYRYGPEYAAVTGYYSLVYNTDGIEEAENSLLAGSDNRLFTSHFADLITGRDPRGGNVTLTLNSAAQKAAYDGLNGRRGAVVAVDPTTGAILAAVSSPSYDPNQLSSHNLTTIRKAWAKDNADTTAANMSNRAFDALYPPGSMFKIVDSAAALKARYTAATKLPAPLKYLLPGTRTYLENYDGESCSPTSTTTLEQALTISCNTAFAGLAVTLGVDRIRAEAQLFGLDDQAGSVPLNVKASTIGPVDNQAELAETGIGQQDVLVTPLAAAMLSATVANGGVRMKPYLVDNETAPDLSVLPGRTQPQPAATAMTPAQAKVLTAMMVNVVANGTGRDASIPGVTVAGKTGTAETVKGALPHAWFTGFAPAAKPKIAVAVILENGGNRGDETTGGKAAAPIAGAVMKAYLSSPEATGR